MDMDVETIHILLVESSKTYAAMIRKALESDPRPVRLTVAQTLTEARTHLSKSVPDLTIIDLLLPDGKGIELLPVDREEVAFPAVLITNCEEVQTAVEMMKAGALDYVVKSAAMLDDMPRIVERALREWSRIAERRRAEKALQSFFESAASGMAIISPEGKALKVNPTFCRISGYSEAEALHKSVFEVTHPGDRDKTRRLYGEIRAGRRKVAADEKRYLCKNGDIVWGRATVAGVFGPNQELLYYAVNVQDITERKRTEEKLRAAHRQMQDIIEFLPDATFVIDRDRKVVAWNRAMEEMSGVSKEEMIGQGDYAYAIPFYGKRRPILIDLIASPVLGKKVQYDFLGNRGETKFVEQYLPALYGGKGAYVWATASRLLDQEGAFAGAIESIRDITDHKKAENNLKGINRELDAFVYTASHDLRTPLTPIIGYADFLKENYKEHLDQQGLDCLAEITIAGERMLALMEDLLFLARMGHLERPDKPVDTNKVLRKVLVNLASQIAGVGAAVQTGSLPRLQVPETLLNQILANLIGNALRYGVKKGGSIKVGGERREDRVLLFVRDHGPGITKDELKRIFDVFFRGETGTKSKGSGVGLAIVQKIARLYRGRAWVEETPGGGSTFWVELVDVLPSAEKKGTNLK